MDKQAFLDAIETVMSSEHAPGGIGTLGEKTLHMVLKHYFEPCGDAREVRLGPFIADIVGENGIIEIQTQGFDKLRKKLAAFLEVAAVTVVYPIASAKWLIWIDPDTGEAVSRRKSPKRGSFYQAFYEIYKIKMLMPHPNLRLRLMLLDIEEYRSLHGWSRDKKRGSTRHERIPVAAVDELALESARDYLALVPFGAGEQFTTRDYSRETGLTMRGAQTALNVLFHIGAVSRAGKRGALYLYEKLNVDTP